MSKIIQRVRDKLTSISNLNKINKDHDRITALKNRYAGKRCFIIGNGPSLTPEDLELLRSHKEFCFGSNRVYQIYGRTKWRPDIYCVQDYKLICASTAEISAVDAKLRIVSTVPQWKYPPLKGFLRVRHTMKEFYPEPPEFSEDISDCIYEGFTVSYMCIQTAAYLGFREMVLLGVDHSYSQELTADGKVRKFDGVRDHFSDKDKADNLPQLYRSTLAYEAAKAYADAHGIKIYNATRGGKLEVFERRPLEMILED